MAEQQQLDVLKQGAGTWNAWRRAHRTEPVDLSGADLSDLALARASLRSANLSGARMAGTDLRRANLRNANLAGAQIIDANLNGADLRDAVLSQANLGESTLGSADLTGANLWRAQLWETSLHETVLDGADLTLANLTNARFQGASLQGASLVDARVVEASLTDCDFTGANLQRADLRRTDLQDSWFEEAFLNGARLCEADLGGAVLLECDLTGADLSRARLLNTRIERSNVQGADFSDGDFGGSTLISLNLSDATGLETAVHWSRSAVTLDTLVLSRGQLPGTFLRGIGVPKAYVAYLEDFRWGAIRYQSCFISHAEEDQAFVDKLKADLDQRGISYWEYTSSMHGGEQLASQLREAIRMHDRFLLVLSPHGTASEWVEEEIRMALQFQQDGGQKLLYPIRLVSYEVLEAWKGSGAEERRNVAQEVLAYPVVDFSAWEDPQAYEKSFAGLLRDLEIAPSKADEPSPPAPVPASE